MLRSLIKLRGLGAALLLTACGVQPVRAQQAANPMPRYQVPGWEYAAFVAVGVVMLIPNYMAEKLPYATCAPCDPSGLWGIDRMAIGDVDYRYTRITDVLQASSMVGGLALTASARDNQTSEAKVEDMVVFSEAVVITGAVTEWSKLLFRRPRPPRYTANAHLYPEADYGRSFPSGHTSTTFAAAAAYMSILQQRGEASRHGTEIGVMFGVAALTGALRVKAHKHFPTDVLAGARRGPALGWAVPRLHPTQ